MKILVIGATGQVGSELRSATNSQEFQGGHRPRVIFCDRKDLDLTRLHTIGEYLNLVAPTIIVNASAFTAVDQAESQSDLAYLVNEAAVREMARFCRKSRCCLIHISTDYVFDGWSDRPYVESDEVCPAGVYGKSKLAGEIAIREILDEHIILRTSWVFGTQGSNFVKTMLRLARTRSELGVVGDQYGAPTSAKGIAKVISNVASTMSAARSGDKRWGIYHYSGQPFVSWAEFANEIFAQALGLGLIGNVPRVNPILTSEYPTSAVRPANSRLDCSKLQSVFGVEPDDWKSSLGLVLDELKEGIQN